MHTADCPKSHPDPPCAPALPDNFLPFAEAKELLDSGETDPELREMAQAELESSKEELEQLKNDLKRLLLPKNPDDDRNVIIEIRGGAGGEASTNQPFAFLKFDVAKLG